MFSLRAANKKGLEFKSDAKTCKFYRDGETILIGERIGRLYKLKLKIITPSKKVAAAVAEETETLQIWHERLGHQNYNRVRRLLID